jgi:signal transduction histidine kinase
MEERIRSLAIQISRASEREQQKIAGVIHDRLVQPLVSARLSLEGLKQEENMPESVVSRLDNALKILGELAKEMRNMAHELYPPVLTHLNVDEMLHWLVEQTRDQYHFEIAVQTEGTLPSLDSERKYFMYLAVRELVYNISRHADAKHVRMTLSADPKEITVTVQDDGRGIEDTYLEKDSYRGGGFGLFHIQMRLEQYGGALSIDSHPGKGTAISVRMPVADA